MVRTFNGDVRDKTMLDLQVSEIAVYGFAYHTDRSVAHNEVNPGLGLRFKRPQDSFFYMVGDYKNSDWKNSVYFGVGKEFWNFGPVSVRAVAGGITGYKMAVMPVILPEVALKWGGYGVVVNFIPPTPWNSGVFGLSFIRSF